MSDHGTQSLLVDVELYVRSQLELRKLKSRLPRQSVENLAREVIQRLSEREIESTVQPPSEDQIERLCHALLSEDDHAGAQFVQDVRSEGISVEAVYLNYLTGAARMLGVWWEDDLITFSEVTLGTSRMYAIMRALRHQFAIASTSQDRSAVFASVPGETHTLGVRMAADLFRKDGWDIELMVGRSHDELVSEIKHSNARLIGISAAGEHSLTALTKLVVALRISNPNASIFVSGHVVEEAKDAIDLMGLDGVVTDIPDARGLMSSLWEAAS